MQFFREGVDVDTRRRKKTAESRVIEGELLSPTPQKKIALSDLESTRREMASVYRDMRSGRIDTQDGTRLVYALAQIGKLIELAMLERRIGELEKQLLEGAE